VDHGARDVAPAVGQEGRHLGHFVRPAHSPHGNAGEDAFPDLFRKVRRHVRVDEAGRNRIHKNVPARQLLREGPGEGVQGGLLHRVGDLPPVARVSDDAGDVDDPPPVASYHELPQDALGQVPGPARQGPLLVELFEAHGVDVGIERQARIVDEDVHPPRLVLDPLHDAIDILFPRQVPAEQECFTQLGHQGPGRSGAAPIVNADPKALLRQRSGAGGPDARGGSGYNRNGLVRLTG